jgi:NCK-associated protein 1
MLKKNLIFFFFFFFFFFKTQQHSKKKKIGVLDDVRWSKPIAAFTKKFPEFQPDLEKVPGYQEMVLKAHEHLKELEPWYGVMVDVVDWCNAAIDLLKELFGKGPVLDLATAPDFVAGALDLLRLVVRVHLLLKDWGAANVVRLVTTYYRMYFHHKCAQEPNYGKLCAWIQLYEHGVAELGVQLAPIVQPLGLLLGGSFQLAYFKSRDFNRLTKDGVFSLIVKHDDIAVPTDDEDRWLALHYGDLYEWLVFALIGVPQLLENPAINELAKDTLTKGGYVLPLYRTRTIYPHEEIDAVCKEAKPGKSLSKQRKPVQHFGKEAVASFAHHQEARVFIALAAQSLVTIGGDVPGLLPPKIGMYLGLAAMARYELHWLLMHSTVAPPNDYKRYKPDDIKDRRWGVQLLSYGWQIASLVRKYQKPITDYYEQFCAGADMDSLAKVQLDGAAQAEIDAMRTAIAAGEYRVAYDSWRRGQVAALASTARRPDDVLRATKVARHALIADALTDEVMTHASPAIVWWWNDAFFELFEGCVNSTEGESASHALDFVKVLADVPGLATPFFSKERDRLGKEAVNAANKALIKITKRVCFLLHDVAMTHMRLDHMLADINAVHNVFRKVNRDWKEPKDYVPQPLPGDESKYGARGQGEAAKLRQLQRSCFQLCAAINEQSVIAVYNHAFSPREYLREKLNVQLVNFMRTCVAADDKAGTIQRPTVLERRIGIYSASLQEVEHYVAIDTGELMRDAFLGEVYSATCGMSGSLDYVSRKPEPQQGSMVAMLTDWYADFAINSMPRHACYSPSRKAFVARSGTVPFEQWTDLSELAALARLVGPYGVKQLDQRLLAIMAQHIEGVRTALVNNAGALTAIAKNYFTGPAVSDAVKRIRDLDGAVQELVHLGGLQQLRRILREGLAAALDQSLPYVHRTCELSYENYAANRRREAGLLSMDALAADAGVDTFDADPAFLTLLSATSADENWDLLPYLFAAAFYSTPIQTAIFNSSTNGCENNAHCMPFAVVDIVVGVAGLRGNDDRKLRRRVEHLLEVGAAQVLRLVEGSKDGAVKGYADLPAVVILLEASLVAAHGLVDRATLERVCPYNLSRQCFTEAYESTRQSTM